MNLKSSLLHPLFFICCAAAVSAVAEQPAPLPDSGNAESPIVNQPVDPNGDISIEISGDSAPDARLPLEDLRSFADVFNQIRMSYVEDIEDREILEHAIRGMLSGLDPHSAYLDASSFDDLQSHTTGEFGGLGLEVGMENGFVKVVAPIDDTPAKRAGMQAGDLIIQLDKQPVKGLTLQEAVALMRGKSGEPITLTVVREGVKAPFEVTIVRDVIKVQSVKAKTLEPGYGYIRLAQFQAHTGRDFKRKLEELKLANKPLNGLILDLRNNPGGLLQAAVEVADVLLSDGLIVYTEGRMPSSHSRYEAKSQPDDDSTPLVVLINGGSASASEIVAGAVQDQRRGIVMGSQSFGKGSVQTVLPLSRDRAIKLTTARYYTPDGRSIQAQGIKPDIIVERATVKTIESDRNISEADLAGHLSNDDADNADSSAQSARELAESDNQLYEALNLLKGLNIARSRTP